MTEPNQFETQQPQPSPSNQEENIQDKAAEMEAVPESAAGESTPEKEAKPVEVVQERIDRLRRKQQRSGPVPQLQQQSLTTSGTMKALEDEMDRELAEALGGMSEQDFLGEMGAGKPAAKKKQGTPAEGKKKGKIISIHGPDVFVAIPGSRSEGLLPILQFDEKPEVGMEVEVEIEGYDPANGLLILTRKGAVVEADWSSIAAGMIVEARVTGTNKGGLEVDVNGIRGFMPISQIELFRVDNIEQFVNQRFRCVVTQVDSASKNLVVSRRDLLEKEREESREKLWQELAEGQIREGVVRSLQPFGAFVDLGGVDGLLPVSEISWQRVQHPEDVLHSGQHLKVVILRIDQDRRRLSLGLKQLATSPWDDLETKYPVGVTVTGKVTKLMEFGAFVELEPGIEGLVHISELSPQRVLRVGDVVQTGQEINVQVMQVDKERRRLSLSLRATLKQPSPVEEPTAEEAEEEEVEAPKPRIRTTPLRGGLGSRSEG